MAGQKSILSAAVAMAVLALGASAAGAQELTLKGASCFPIGSPPSKGFEQFVDRMNAEGKGVLQIKMIGGAPAIGSPFTMTRRMARGINDIIGCPDAYYGDVLPEAPVLRLSDFSPMENRENGAWDYLTDLLAKKNVRFVGQAMNNGPFYLWLSKKITEPDLTGMHLRVSPVYTPFFKAMGATVQRSNIAQIYTYMENGTVSGYGWPGLGWVKAWSKVTKYWVDHGFYLAGIQTLMNLDKWKALTAKQRAVFMKVVLAHEVKSEELPKTWPKQKAWMQSQGLQPITFQGADREKWIKTAADTAWAEVIERSPVHGPKLRQLLTRQ